MLPLEVGLLPLTDNLILSKQVTLDCERHDLLCQHLHDETLCPNPFTFNPDRAMQPTRDKQTKKLQDPFAYAFGYGRRIRSDIILSHLTNFQVELTPRTPYAVELIYR